MKTIEAENKASVPIVAKCAQVVGFLALVVGGFILIFAATTDPAPDKFSAVLTAFGLILSSVLWFAMARVIILLAQIAGRKTENKI
jgi:hypothetical protein